MSAGITPKYKLHQTKHAYLFTNMMFYSKNILCIKQTKVTIIYNVCSSSVTRNIWVLVHVWFRCLCQNGSIDHGNQGSCLPPQIAHPQVSCLLNKTNLARCPYTNSIVIHLRFMTFRSIKRISQKYYYFLHPMGNVSSVWTWIRIINISWKHDYLAVLYIHYLFYSPITIYVCINWRTINLDLKKKKKKKTPLVDEQGPRLLTWFNFSLSMDE